MSAPVFDHEKLDVYRLSSEYVAAAYGVAKSLTGANRHLRDPWLRAAPSIPLNLAEGNGKQSLRDKNQFFEIARGSARECAAIRDLLAAFAAVDEEPNHQEKSQLRRIVPMLTRLIQRTDRAGNDPSECEYGDAEYEYEYEYRFAE